MSSASRKKSHKPASVHALTARMEDVERTLQSQEYLSEAQQRAIDKYFVIIETDYQSRKETAVARKSRQPMGLYHTLHRLHSEVGLHVFVLCAMACPPTSLDEVIRSEGERMCAMLKEWSQRHHLLAKELDDITSKYRCRSDRIRVPELGLRLTKTPRQSPTAERDSDTTQPWSSWQSIENTCRMYAPNVLNLIPSEAAMLVQREAGSGDNAILVLPNNGQPYMITPVSYESGAKVIRDRMCKEAALSS